MNIGDRIRDRRIELEMTQEELAVKMGYKSKSTINKIELGINDIPLSKVQEFAKVLFTTEAYLMGWTEEVPAVPDPNEERLLTIYRDMNATGKERLLQYAEDLHDNAKYKKCNSVSEVAV